MISGTKIALDQLIEMGKPNSKHSTAHADGDNSNANSNTIEIVQMIQHHKDSTSIILICILVILVFQCVIKLYKWHISSIKKVQQLKSRVDLDLV